TRHTSVSVGLRCVYLGELKRYVWRLQLSSNLVYPNLKLDSYGRNGFVKVANKLLDYNSRSLHRGLPLKAIQEFGQNSIFLYSQQVERSPREHSNPLLTAILCLILHEACIEVVY